MCSAQFVNGELETMNAPTACEEQETIFGVIKAGLQADGSVLADLGWSFFYIHKQTGIESMVAVGGKKTKKSFMKHLRTITGSELKDWEPCRLDLYLCWFAPLDGADAPFCYSGWRVRPDCDALRVDKCRVIAFRHKAWELLQSGRVKAFQCARQRSYAEALWIKKHSLTSAFTPECMAGVSDTGYHLSGVLPGAQSRIRLTWPSDDFGETVALVAMLESQGISDIALCEGGFGLTGLTVNDFQKLLQGARYYGTEANLIDLARNTGCLHKAE